MIAEYNQIVFKEYLPFVLGDQLMDEYELKVKREGFTQYDSNVDPNGILSASGAAFRFGHTLVPQLFHVLNEPKYESFGFRLMDKYFDLSDLWDGQVFNFILVAPCS